MIINIRYIKYIKKFVTNYYRLIKDFHYIKHIFKNINVSVMEPVRYIREVYKFRPIRPTYLRHDYTNRDLQVYILKLVHRTKRGKKGWRGLNRQDRVQTFGQIPFHLPRSLSSVLFLRIRGDAARSPVVRDNGMYVHTTQLRSLSVKPHHVSCIISGVPEGQSESDELSW